MGCALWYLLRFVRPKTKNGCLFHLVYYPSLSPTTNSTSIRPPRMWLPQVCYHLCRLQQEHSDDKRPSSKRLATISHCIWRQHSSRRNNHLHITRHDAFQETALLQHVFSVWWEAVMCILLNTACAHDQTGSAKHKPCVSQYRNSLLVAMLSSIKNNDRHTQPIKLSIITRA